MEGTMDMTSNTDGDTNTNINTNTNNTAAELAPRKHQQEVVVPSPTKGEEQGSNTKNKKLWVVQQAGDSEEANKSRPQKDTPALNCARCKSTNTKFCYYNNYNLNQPRYFCKSCRRYWTQGGTLRFIPTGGGYRRNKRTSSSSSSPAASSTAATAAEVESTLRTQLVLTVASTITISVSSPTTGLRPNDMPLAITPAGSSGGGLYLSMDGQQGFLPFAPPPPLSEDTAPEELAPGGSDMTPTFAMDNEQQGFLPFALPLPLSHNKAPEELATGWSDTTPTFTMDEQQGFLPFSPPLPLFDDQAPEELAPRWSDTTPAFVDMLTEGYFEMNFPESPTYGGGLAMSGGSNGMDMSFLVPEIGMWAPETDPMVEGVDDVAGELLWPSSELDNYINDYGGYAAGPGAGVEQQQVAGDQQQKENDSKAKESSKKNDDDGDGGSSAYSYWINTNNSDGAEG